MSAEMEEEEVSPFMKSPSCVTFDSTFLVNPDSIGEKMVRSKNPQTQHTETNANPQPFNPRDINMRRRQSLCPKDLKNSKRLAFAMSLQNLLPRQKQDGQPNKNEQVDPTVKKVNHRRMSNI